MTNTVLHSRGVDHVGLRYGGGSLPGGPPHNFRAQGDTQMAKAKAASGGGMLVAKESFSTRFEGADHSFTPDGPFVREGHPILRGIEHLFKPVTAHPTYEVEQATAAPGEL